MKGFIDIGLVIFMLLLTMNACLSNKKNDLGSVIIDCTVILVDAMVLLRFL